MYDHLIQATGKIRTEKNKSVWDRLFIAILKDLQLYREIQSEQLLYSNRTKETQLIRQCPLIPPTSLPRLPKGGAKETSPWFQPGRCCAWCWPKAQWSISPASSLLQHTPGLSRSPKRSKDTWLHVASYMIIAYLVFFSCSFFPYKWL